VKSFYFPKLVGGLQCEKRGETSNFQKMDRAHGQETTNRTSPGKPERMVILRRRRLKAVTLQETQNKGTDLSEDLLNGSVAGEVDDDVFVRSLAVRVYLPQYRIRLVYVTDSNDVDVHVKLLVDNAAIDSLQPWQRYTGIKN